jgi:hypothetical protein
VLALCSVACARQDERLAQHKEKFESLGSTTNAIATAWLNGDTSSTYTLTALEQTFLLVEQERSALATSTGMLVDPRGASLSQSAERLSRLIARITEDVRTSDGAEARRHLADIPIRPETH